MPKKALARSQPNQLQPEDRVAHDWYRFVLSYPPHLVREYLNKFDTGPSSVVLDPFCGTGTTLVECKKLGIPCQGVEANQMAAFASRVKVDWSPSPGGLWKHAQSIAERTLMMLERDGIDDEVFFSLPRQPSHALRTIDPDQMKLLLKNSISPLPLHKVLTLAEGLAAEKRNTYLSHEQLALATALVSQIGNLHFGPEVGVRDVKEDAPVVAPWLRQVKTIADDLEILAENDSTPASVHAADAREIHRVIAPRSIDAVITSPPYPNEKDYTRTTRLESVLLGFLQNRKQLRAMKEGLLRSNTRNVFAKDTDDQWVKTNQKVQDIAVAIEKKRLELGKDSGFERLYNRVAKLYFGGMARHFANLRPTLKPGARLAYVVGDQASYFRVMIRTGELLAEIAEIWGYNVLGLDLFRHRFATATREQLREEVVLLQWKGNAK
jgi:hypothetical protein